jgi:hypothetical protein
LSFHLLDGVQAYVWSKSCLLASETDDVAPRRQHLSFSRVSNSKRALNWKNTRIVA